ncbi:hypothetical protein [Streptomyces misionensis]|uniref:hypothetical protein n=1 Tax=Streptomyces misionensis TaxID=67331 RepID=UPI0036C21CF7
MTDRKTASTINDTELDQLYERLARAEAQLADYENRITWHTTCAACARLLDSSIRETERRERAEATIARVRELRDDLREITGARWIADMLDTILNQSPSAEAIQAPQPREHCGDPKPPLSGESERTECVLRPGHPGSHADQHDTRWWRIDQEHQP